MNRVYKIKNIRFEDDSLVLEVDEQTIKLKLAKISDKLAKASKEEREAYKVSPSGYGISWKLLDEDLSVNGLLQESQKSYGK